MRRGKSGLNLLLGIDKPVGMTSHDVVNRVRRALDEGRVGHAGTLDPAASGVMVVGVGQGTRLMGLLTAEEKTYVAAISFGAETDTDDAEGRPVRTAEVPRRLLDGEYAAEVVSGLVGPHSQVPPAYSAISVGGKRAYALARAGREVELDARDITIFSAQLIGVGEAEDGSVEWTCALRVSKGTYVRSIARDLGRELGTAAHLSNLRRTSSGLVELGMCLTLGRVDELGAAGIREGALDPVEMLGLPCRVLEGKESEDVACGRRIEVGRVVDPREGHEVELSEGDRVALCKGGRLMGVWKRRGGVLCCDVNFPDGVEGVRVCEE